MTLTLDDSVRLAALKLWRPWDVYEPSAGQRAFHQAKQRTRALFPGNRWGKSTATGIEAAIQADLPGSIVLWICPQYKQFELLRPQLESQCFGKSATYVHDDGYRWPNGSRLFLIPRERDWTFIQGINPDLVIVDEECPLPLWRELAARGAGQRRTRYIIAATATTGAETWMKSEIYDVWVRFHKDRGLDEDRAAELQLNPDLWVLPKGSIRDNVSLDDEAKRHFLGLRWGSVKEKRVRDEGGFDSWLGDPVFDQAGIDRLRGLVKRGELGWLELKK